jgi:hypothetical protein
MKACLRADEIEKPQGEGLERPRKIAYRKQRPAANSFHYQKRRPKRFNVALEQVGLRQRISNVRKQAHDRRFPSTVVGCTSTLVKAEHQLAVGWQLSHPRRAGVQRELKHDRLPTARQDTKIGYLCAQVCGQTGLNIRDVKSHSNRGGAFDRRIAEKACSMQSLHMLCAGQRCAAKVILPGALRPLSLRPRITTAADPGGIEGPLRPDHRLTDGGIRVGALGLILQGFRRRPG